MTPVTYVTRNGLLEPLGQSQIFAYLRGLSKDYRITLITFEKPEDRANVQAMAEARWACEELGIRWLPQKFRRGPRIVAPALSILRMYRLARQEVLRGNAHLVHARSYIPAIVALGLWRRTGVPFIFDMRALWPEELISARRLRRGSPLHRLIEGAEWLCLRHAAGVVSLTYAAVAYLDKKYPETDLSQKTVVIPTCADLDRFQPAKRPPEEKVIGCLGTLLSGWFRIDWLAAFIRAAAGRDSGLRFQMTTRDDPAAVLDALDLPRETLERVEISSSPSNRVHEVLQGQIASVMFFVDGPAKIGSSPTRMGEILGCGLPVVANEGVGDVAKIIREYRVGVLAEGPAPEQMARALDELEQLRCDPELPTRCRAAAEAVFSLEGGTRAYAALYRRILDKSAR
jgi:glycosyltransferase involved in cell wall biosynthesis